MDPSTFEMPLMLRVNKQMWSEKTIQDIMNKKKKINRERKRRWKIDRELENIDEELDEEGNWRINV
jgi:hypothetical protein